jgi:hypothetical protein
MNKLCSSGPSSSAAELAAAAAASVEPRAEGTARPIPMPAPRERPGDDIDSAGLSGARGRASIIPGRGKDPSVASGARPGSFAGCNGAKDGTVPANGPILDNEASGRGMRPVTDGTTGSTGRARPRGSGAASGRGNTGATGATGATAEASTCTRFAACATTSFEPTVLEALSDSLNLRFLLRAAASIG